MFIKKRKILCYVLIYKEFDIIKKSIDFITNLSDELDIVIIENPSAETPRIGQYIEDLGKNKKICRYYLFEKNITNNAYDIVLQKELSLIDRNPYVIITDGDLIVENGENWLKETMDILKYKDVFCCGASLMIDNLPTDTFPDARGWIPELINDKPFNEGITGCHLLTMKGNHLSAFMAWKNENNRSFTDGEMSRYCYNVLHKKWARTKNNRAYHITWDLYKNIDNEYTKLKTNKSFEDTWYHKNTSSYTLLNFS